MLSWGYEPTGKDLKCQYSYRFQVEGYNNHEAHFGESRSRLHALDPKNRLQFLGAEGLDMAKAAV